MYASFTELYFTKGFLLQKMHKTLLEKERNNTILFRGFLNALNKSFSSRKITFTSVVFFFVNSHHILMKIRIF